MKTGFTYWHPVIYRSIMHILYGSGFYSRYEAILDLLPEGADVIDVCCGDCYIDRFLAKKNINYLGLDLNSRFIEHALKKGIKARLFNIENSTVPRAEYIIMQGSLYQFMPRYRLIIDKLIFAADKAVIISEPITNVASCKNSMTAYLAMLATRVNGNNFFNRFTKEGLLDLFREYNVSLVREIKGGKDLIGLFKKGDKR